MTTPSSFSILRAPAWPALARRLASAASVHGELGPAVDALLRPLRLLDMLAADALRALGDDALAAERFHAVLCVAEPWQQLLDDVAKRRPQRRGFGYQPGVIHHGRLTLVVLAALRVSAHGGEGESAVRSVLGLVLGASAVEVLGRSEPGQLAGAELGTILLSLFDRGALGEPTPAVLQAFASDAAERSRWRCLLAAFDPKLLQLELKGPWDGASADAIDDVIALDGWPGTLRVSGRLSSEKPLLDKKKLQVLLASAEAPPVAVVPSNVSAQGFELAIAPSIPPGWVGFSNPKRIEESNAFREQLRARWAELSLPGAAEPYRELLRDAPVPADLIALLGPELSVPPRTGKNGFAGGRPRLLGAAIERAAAAPDQLQLSWDSVGARYVRVKPRIGGAGDRLPPSGSLLVPAPGDQDKTYTLTPVAERTLDPSAQKQATSVAKQEASATKKATQLEGDSVRLVASATSSASAQVPLVRITSVTLGQLGGSGSPPYLAGAPIAVQLLFEPASASPAARLVVGGEALEAVHGRGGRLELLLPGARVVSGKPLSLAVELEPGGRVELGPYEVREARHLSALVLVRPAVLREGQPVLVTLDTARAALLAACRSMNVQLEPEAIYELPWLDDPLAVLSNDVRSAEDPRVPFLLEQLSRVAARSPGFEEALWLVLVPDERDLPEGGDGEPIPVASRLPESGTVLTRHGFESHLPAEAARSVAVANREGLELLFARLFSLDVGPPECRPASRRLRLVGSIARGGELTLDPSREEFRRAGAGAPVDSGLLAVTYDADGRELQRVPVRTLRDFPPARFALLLPVSDEVQLVELQLDERVLYSLSRVVGAPKLTLTRETAAGQIEWSYAHSTGAAPSFELELVAGDISVPALVLARCSRAAELPVQRFRGSEGLRARLVASDGWNTASALLELSLGGQGSLIARRVNSAEWWADSDLGGHFAWTLDGKEIGQGRLLTIDPRAAQRGVAEPGKVIRTLSVIEANGAGQIIDSRLVGGSDA